MFNFRLFKEFNMEIAFYKQTELQSWELDQALANSISLQLCSKMSLSDDNEDSKNISYPHELALIDYSQL